MKKAALGHAICPQSNSDFSFELWRRIFQVIVANEKKALDTGVAVAFTIEVSERDADHQAAILIVDLICEPNMPAREMPGDLTTTCDDAVAITMTHAACSLVPLQQG